MPAFVDSEEKNEHIDKNYGRFRLLSEFFSNMAVVWFAAAFVALVDWFLVFKGAVNGTIALSLALF